ncbi:pilin [Candidatus Parcubacteria bacterium]|nr:pilin [Candidatus Parcubacteria bacterium]
MIKRIRQNLITSLAGVFALSLFALPVFAGQTTFAQDSYLQNSLCQGGANITENPLRGKNAGVDCQNATRDADEQLNNLIRQVINVFSIIVGVVAVIMIIYGGFRYITSGGDSGNVGTAKNTILYAIIGLVLVALAQFIVKFVLNRTTI